MLSVLFTSWNAHSCSSSSRKLFLGFNKGRNSSSWRATYMSETRKGFHWFKKWPQLSYIHRLREVLWPCVSMHGLNPNPLVDNIYPSNSTSVDPHWNLIWFRELLSSAHRIRMTTTCWTYSSQVSLHTTKSSVILLMCGIPFSCSSIIQLYCSESSDQWAHVGICISQMEWWMLSMSMRFFGEWAQVLISSEFVLGVMIVHHSMGSITRA